jgi:hypothetical protein
MPEVVMLVDAGILGLGVAPAQPLQVLAPTGFIANRPSFSQVFRNRFLGDASDKVV